MSKVHNDFLGPFVECNGSINRPPSKTALKLAGKVVAKNVLYTPTVRVIDESGAEEVWHSCGQASAYHEAVRSLPKAEFEHFAAFNCGFEFSYNDAARALYPQMATLFPNRMVDYRSKEVSDHMAFEKSLAAADGTRRHAAYMAKRGGVLPAPAGPAPVRLKALTMSDVLAQLGVAPTSPATASTPAPAPPPPRRRPKP